MNLTVLQKGLILAALPLVFQFAFVLVIVRAQAQHQETVRLASHSKDVIAHTYEISTRVSDADAGIRGHVLTGDPSFTDRSRMSSQILSDRFDVLEAYVSDNPRQVQRARAIRQVAADLLVWQAGLERLMRAGAAEAAIDLVRSGRGKELQVAFRNEIEAFLAEEHRLDRERFQALEKSREWLNALFLGGGIVAVGSTLTLGFAFKRGIARRFARLELNAQQLAACEVLPLPIDGHDEIARLDRAFRDMALALRERSEQVRDLYDNAPCGYHSVGPEGTIVAINRTELMWLGYDAADVIGRMRFSEMVSPSSREAYLKGFAHVREHGSVVDLELELVRKNGTTFPVLINSTSLRDAAGEYLRSRTTLTDLTERKRAEAVARLFADVANHVPIGLLILQFAPSGQTSCLTVRSANPFASRVLGVVLDSVVGQPVTRVFPAISDDLLQRYEAVALTGRPDNIGEFKYGDDRVTERWWAVQAFPLPDRSVGVAFQDVSDRKHAEEQLRQLNEELEDRVEQRTTELELANSELLHKNAENEMFVYSVSHDLRSPLVNLQGFSKELDKAARGLAVLLDAQGVPSDIQDQGRTLLDGKVRKSIGFIQAAVLRLAGIIDALLRLSRAGRVEYRMDVVDIAQVVGQVVAAIQGTLSERRATVQVRDLPSAYGDRTALEQVFANLIGNALTYLDPARPGVIEIGGNSDAGNGTRTYFVRDNGLGIAEGHRHKIFQAFQRAHPGVGSGEGLGLAIVSRVVERHRGRVWVESTPGTGSTFFVTLPAPPGE